MVIGQPAKVFWHVGTAAHHVAVRGKKIVINIEKLKLKVENFVPL